MDRKPPDWNLSGFKYTGLESTGLEFKWIQIHWIGIHWIGILVDSNTLDWSPSRNAAGYELDRYLHPNTDLKSDPTSLVINKMSYPVI
jgi:hypothetical protein